MVETETTLLVLSDNPSVVVKEIVSLKSIIGYTLQPAPSKRIHDIYLDTTDLALEHQKLALRIRKIDSSQFVTLKGPSHLREGGSLERLEIEDSWSERSFERMIAELEKRNLKLTTGHLVNGYRFNEMSPLDILSESGLKVIQDRVTNREILNIMGKGPENNNQILAELAVDLVTYHSNVYDNVSLYEVEIEAKQDDAFRALETISENLLEMFKGELVRWRYSKIATGKAINILLSKGVLQGLIMSNNNNNTLTSRAFKKIEEQLRTGEI